MSRKSIIMTVCRGPKYDSTKKNNPTNRLVFIESSVYAEKRFMVSISEISILKCDSQRHHAIINCWSENDLLTIFRTPACLFLLVFEFPTTLYLGHMRTVTSWRHCLHLKCCQCGESCDRTSQGAVVGVEGNAVIEIFIS